MRCSRANHWFLTVLLVSVLLALLGCERGSVYKPEVDTTPPIVSSVTAIDMYHVRAVFNEKVGEGSAESSAHYSITPVGGGGLVTISSVVLLADQKTVSIETSGQSSISYILSVSGVKDLAGNPMTTQALGFQGSGEADTTPPVVARTDPENNETGVDTTAAVAVEFSEKMARSSVESRFYLGSVSGGSVTGSFAWEASDTRVVFTPASHLKNYRTYNAGVTAGAADANGNGLASAYTWSFVTGNVGTITGTITYTGGSSPTSVVIGVFHDVGFTDDIASTNIDGPGSYSVYPVPSCTCYVGGYMDLNLSGEPDEGEPCGIYDTNGDTQPDPIIVTADRTKSGVNFELKYQFKYSTISGTVAKGSVTESDTTYVMFFENDPTKGDAGDPVDWQVLPNGYGAFTSSPMFFGRYYVICYMDTNHNHEIDMNGDTPTEPVGFYGKIENDEPVLTPILLVTDFVGIDMTLTYLIASPSPILNFSRPVKLPTSLRGRSRHLSLPNLARTVGG